MIIPKTTSQRYKHHSDNVYWYSFSRVCLCDYKLCKLFVQCFLLLLLELEKENDVPHPHPRDRNKNDLYTIPMLTNSSSFSIINTTHIDLQNNIK